MIPSKERGRVGAVWHFHDYWYWAVLAITERYYVHFSDLAKGRVGDETKDHEATVGWQERWRVFEHMQGTYDQIKVDSTDIYYTHLHLMPNAPIELVKAAHRALSKIYHPDNKQSGDEARFRQVQTAYEILTNGH